MDTYVLKLAGKAKRRGNWAEAASFYEQESHYSEAVECYWELGKYTDVLRCLALSGRGDEMLSVFTRTLPDGPHGSVMGRNFRVEITLINAFKACGTLNQVVNLICTSGSYELRNSFGYYLSEAGEHGMAARVFLASAKGLSPESDEMKIRGSYLMAFNEAVASESGDLIVEFGVHLAQQSTSASSDIGTAILRHHRLKDFLSKALSGDRCYNAAVSAVWWLEVFFDDLYNIDSSAPATIYRTLKHWADDRNFGDDDDFQRRLNFLSKENSRFRHC